MARRLLFAFILLGSLISPLAAPSLALAQAVPTTPKITGAAPIYTFGSPITFQARLTTAAPVEAAQIYFQHNGDGSPQVKPATLIPVGEGAYDLGFVYDPAASPLRAFSQLEYWYEVTFQDGQLFRSQVYDFYYEDNRYNWQTREVSPFRVHYYRGDLAFANQVIQVAQDGLKRVQSLLNPKAPQVVDIYVYTSASEMQATLTLSGENWVAGHADPDLGVMVVALPATPEQQILMQQRIPHELMHILLYQSNPKGYANLPTWLSEGLASVSELYPNPDYQVLLENAQKKKAFLPMSSLCQSFPRDASNALLAYAQSSAFTRYLYQTYGAAGLQLLVKNYTSGLDCDAGLQSALNMSLAQVERQWRQAAFAEDATLAGLASLLPWLAILAAVLVAPLLAVFSRRKKTPGPAKVPTPQARG